MAMGEAAYYGCDGQHGAEERWLLGGGLSSVPAGGEKMSARRSDVAEEREKCWQRTKDARC